MASRDRWDHLFEVEDYRALMGSEDVEPGLERGDGFYISHEVRVTAPWAESLVRTGARPRVQNRIIVRGNPAEELAAARASLKGRKGKSRQLLKRRIERLEATVRMAERGGVTPTAR